MQLRGTQIVVDTIAAKKPVISGSGATRTLNESESGSVVLFDRAAGIVYTLPTAKPGVNFEFLTTTTITSNLAKILAAKNVAGSTAYIVGSIINVDTDSSDAIAAWRADGTTHIALSANGTTTGGIAGSKLSLVSDGTRWFISGITHGSATVATPFATS